MSAHGPEAAARRRGGHPSKPTSLALEVLSAIGVGTRRWEVSGAAGIVERTLQTWLSRGRAGEELYDELARAIRLAERWLGLGPMLPKTLPRR